jgi:carbonic anhydrase
VKERVEAGTLELHGAVFAIADGKLRVLQDSGAFEPA